MILLNSNFMLRGRTGLSFPMFLSFFPPVRVYYLYIYFDVCLGVLYFLFFHEQFADRGPYSQHNFKSIITKHDFVIISN